MSYSRTIRGLVLLVLGALVGVGSAGETEATGVGYSSVGRPPESDNPPNGYTDGEQSHDPDEGRAYVGVNAYELYQGATPDSRERHRKTDFVKWFVNGATLKARGQVQDADPAETTRVVSDAWGMKVIAVKVGQDEGRYGKIRAQNDIAFEYSFSASGSAIAEATVRLSGTAFDINGLPHSFALSASESEGVTVRQKERDGLSVGNSGRLRGRTGVSGAKPSASLDGEAKFEVDSESESESEETRRFGSASAVTGIDGQVALVDEVTGVTPLEKRYAVYSDADVAMTARTAVEGGSVVITLDRFIVKNLLRCWKSASESPDGPPPPPPSDPGAPTPTTPGPGDGSGGDDGGSGGGDGGHVAIDPPPYKWPFGGGCILIYPHPPHGFVAEPGSLPGFVELRMTGPAPRDLRIAVASEPAGALDLAAATMVIEEGGRLGGMPFHARAAGATLVLTLLDEAGGEDGRIHVPIDTASTSASAEPRIWVALPTQSADPGRVRGVAGLVGETVGPLRVGRLGFTDFATEATTVRIAVEGAPAVMAALPLSVTIPAGEDVVELPLVLGSAAGSAVVTLTHGEQVTHVHVRTHDQSWRGVPRVIVPVGAVAAVPFIVRHAQRSDRLVSATAADPLLVDAVDDERTAELRAGERAWFVPFAGRMPGVTEVVLTSPGLPSLVVPVEVTPEWLRIEQGRLVISELDGTRAGQIHLSAPADVVFADIELPATAADYLEIEGLGTSQLTLVFTPSADLPATLSLPLQMVGPAAPHEIAVYDTVHGALDAPVRNSYRVTVR